VRNGCPPHACVYRRAGGLVFMHLFVRQFVQFESPCLHPSQPVYFMSLPFIGGSPFTASRP
jgi:hypothetical protein